MLYGPQYEPYGWVVTYVAVAYFFLYVATVVGVGLKARAETAAVFRAYVVAAAVALTIGALLVQTLGLLGAALGTIVHAAIIALAFSARFWWHTG